MRFSKILSVSVRWLFCFSILLQWSSCVRPVSSFEKLPPGKWRAVLLLDRAPVQKYGDDRDVVKKFDFDSELPFNFEVVYPEGDSMFQIVIYNAEEKIVVDDIEFGRDFATAKDTVLIHFPVFDSYIKAIYEDGVMEGEWVVNYRENYRIPFKAVHGQDFRFSNNSGASAMNVSGKWATVFSEGKEDAYKAVGEFVQQGDEVTGTFLTETGDFRYLEGQVIGKKLYLSVFDGAHAWLFIAKMMEDGTLSGIYRSGSHYTTDWNARRDDTAVLSDPYTLTRALDDKALQFSFMNTKMERVSLNDSAFEGKAKIVQLMGTWCPNCLDETRFLQEYFKNNPDQNLAWISLCFERYQDTLPSMAAIRRFEEKTGVNHTVLWAGNYAKTEASKALPQLNRIIAYPTLLFLDRQNRIVKIHTGFNGPATKEYAAFKDEFSKIIADLHTNH
ncbi:MAG: TlpA family protein disulfide reductase [Saprospiraceae bacterium]|nr:TlpA family protein disulfide reductase [Saprospiraceae bacterium]